MHSPTAAVLASVLASGAWVAAVMLGSTAFGLLGLALGMLSIWMFTAALSDARQPRETGVAVDESLPAGRGRHDSSVNLPETVVPSSMEPRAVVRSLLEVAKGLGDAVAAHLWLSDPTTGSLRLVASDGPLAPSDEPVSIDDGVLGQALISGTVVVHEINRFTSPATGTTAINRAAYPLTTGEVSGVGAVDFAGPAPSGPALTRLGGLTRLQLSAALGMHTAHRKAADALNLVEAARELSRALDPKDVLDRALSRAMKLTNAATGSIMLLDDETGTLTITTATGLPVEVVESTVVRIGEGIAGWVAASGQPVLVEDLPGKKSSSQRHGVRSAVSVPIADEEGLLGVLNVGSRAFPARFTQDDLDSLEILGRQTGVALSNARAITEAGSLYYDSLKVLAIALETKDPYATGGTERVIEYATGIAREMKLGQKESRAIEIAAMLHDVGMAAVRGQSSECDRPLSTVERGMLKMHPVIASEILAQAPALREVAPIVYHHHEHFDGSGYVEGVAGDRIPLGARILAVADAYVAMTSERSYRAARSSREALAELHEKAGTQFDPRVVEALTDFLGREANRVPGT